MESDKGPEFNIKTPVAKGKSFGRFSIVASLFFVHYLTCSDLFLYFFSLTLIFSFDYKSNICSLQKLGKYNNLTT